MQTVKARVPFREIDLTRLMVDGYASYLHDDHRRSVWVLARAGTEYDLLSLHREGKRINAGVTPHGWFWRLPHENLSRAVDFLHTFGPFSQVTLQADGGDEYAWLDLGDFWNKQRRFHAVTKLWIALEDTTAMQESWVQLHAQLSEIDNADDFPLGCIPQARQAGYVELELAVLRQLRNLGGDQAEVSRWLAWQDPATLRREAIELVTGELHGHLRHLTRWRPTVGKTVRPAFELTLAPDNLWTALWYLFALDTQRGVGWRICPNDQNLFYPPRKDRVCCTPQEQKTRSENSWWRRNKDTELEKRRAARKEEARPNIRRREPKVG